MEARFWLQFPFKANKWCEWINIKLRNALPNTDPMYVSMILFHLTQAQQMFSTFLISWVTHCFCYDKIYKYMFCLVTNATLIWLSYSGAMGWLLARRKCMHNRRRGGTNKCSHVKLWEYHKIYASWGYEFAFLVMLLNYNNLSLLYEWVTTFISMTMDT